MRHVGRHMPRLRWPPVGDAAVCRQMAQYHGSTQSANISGLYVSATAAPPRLYRVPRSYALVMAEMPETDAASYLMRVMPLGSAGHYRGLSIGFES